MRLAKTASYSAMHLAVAIAVAYALTRDWRTALAIGLFEPAAQTVAYAFHDRFWSRHESARPSRDAGHACGHASVSTVLAWLRTANLDLLTLKVVSYGLMHMTVAIAVAFALTRDWRAALAVGIIEPLVQTLAYTVHHHLWSRVGAPKLPSANLQGELA